ncbi:MAG: hypothetical protein ACRD19_04650 [Terriglobia bacterium]
MRKPWLASGVLLILLPICSIADDPPPVCCQTPRTGQSAATTSGTAPSTIDMILMVLKSILGL